MIDTKRLFNMWLMLVAVFGSLLAGCGSQGADVANVYKDTYPAGLEIFQPTYKKLDELTAASDLVVTGTVVDYVEDIGRDGGAPTDEAIAGGDNVYVETVVDGIMFKIDETFKGGELIPGKGNRTIVILVPAQSVDSEGEIVAGPPKVESVDVIREGVEAVNRSAKNRPRYALFLRAGGYNSDKHQQSVGMPVFDLHATGSVQLLTEQLQVDLHTEFGIS